MLRKIVHIFNIKIVEKGAHLNFAMGAIFHRYATVHVSLVLVLRNAAPTPFRYLGLGRTFTTSLRSLRSGGSFSRTQWVKIVFDQIIVEYKMVGEV